jgi:hypothetical protein
MTRPKASISDVKEFFGNVTMPELKALKVAPSTAGNATAYDDLAYGIGDKTYNY